MSDLSDFADGIIETLEDNDVPYDEDDVLNRLDAMVNQYSVPTNEARRSVLRHYADEHDTELDGVGGDNNYEENAEADLADLDGADQWADVEVELTTLWSSDSDSVQQTGLVADETGQMKFTAWADSDVPEMEEGQQYRLESVVTDVYQGRTQIQLNSSTEVTPLDKEIDAAEQETSEDYGVIVDIQSGSGLIKRCEVDDCTRVLNNGRCSEHGEQDGEHDIRVKAVLDDGEEVQDVLFDDDATEEFVGITLEDAKEMAAEALDPQVVTDEVEDALIGRYYAVEGPIVGRYLLVEDAHEFGEPDDSVQTVRDRLAEVKA